MDVVYTRCCGLDIHKKPVVACLILSTEGWSPQRGPDLPDDDRRPVRVGRLAPAGGLYPRRHGKHRRLLAPGLQSARRAMCSSWG